MNKSYVYSFVLFAFTSAMTSCSVAEHIALRSFEKQIAAAPDAAEYLINDIKQGKKLIMIGDFHGITNEMQFLTENLDKFYDAGVRYLFLESRIPDFAVPGNENYFFFMFYPWVLAGWRYENVSFYQKVLELCNKEDDPLIMIVPEEGRAEYEGNDPSEHPEFVNYRDSYAADNVIKTLEKAGPDAKGLMFYGTNHCIKKILYKGEEDWATFDRVPMGYLLAKKYGDDCNSYLGFYNENFFQDKLNGEEIAQINKPRITLSKDIKYSFVFNNDEHETILTGIKHFDGRIVTQNTKVGTFYQYAPTDENLRFLFNLVKKYETEKHYETIDTQFSGTDPQAQYLMAIYYLKLYFGAHFDYSFWRQNGGENNLLTALKKLEDYAFSAGKNPSRLMDIQYSYETMLDWSTLMTFAGLNGYLDDHYMRSQTLDNCKKALEIFPEEIWSLYWLGFVNTEEGDYGAGLAAFQQLFKNPLSCCMESLPLAYSKAAVCAERTGTAALAEEYRRISASLINEHNIDVSGYYYTGHLFDK